LPWASKPLDSLDSRRDFAAQRQAIIAANAELRERELIKIASIASALAEALRRRGVSEPDASLAAEAGMAVFRVAFNRWTAAADEAEFSQLVRESFEHLKTVSAGR
jgi:MftR C-terminal domain